LADFFFRWATFGGRVGMATSLWEHFYVLSDPRVERTKKHKLEDILTVTICAVICGADTWNDIEDFGEAKERWFRTFLELPLGQGERILIFLWPLRLRKGPSG
jgi:hypothetical protein